MFARQLATLLLVAHVAPAVCQPPPDQDSARQRIRAALDRGAFADAERGAEALASAVSSERGPTSLEAAQASDLWVEALLKNGRAGAPSTLALAQQTLAIKERRLGSDALDTAISLHNLGAIHVERGEPKAALPLHERGLSIRTKHLPADASALADSLDHLATVLMQMEHWDRAAEALGRARSIREARGEAEPRALARTLELQCWWHRYKARYDAAWALLPRVLELRRQLPSDHPERAWTKALEGDLFMLESKAVKAREAWTESLAMIERTLGSEHPMVIRLQRRLVLANETLGDRNEVKRLMDAATTRSERVLAPCSNDRLALSGYVGTLLAYEGAYAQARAQYQRVRASYEKCFGPRDSGVCTMVYNLALNAYRMGDFAEAERLHLRTIRTWSAVFGPTHPFVMRAWDGLAEVAAARGQRTRARRLYEHVLRELRRASTPDPPHIAWTLTNLARVLADAGGLVQAARSVREAIQIFGKAPFDEPDHLARALSLRGEIESRLGDDRAARASFSAAIAARAQIFGPSHPLTAQARANLASAKLRLYDYDAALADALTAEEAGRDHLRFTIRYLPERQAMTYAASRPRGLDLALSVGASDASVPRAPIVDAVIQSRGVILDELAARARAADTPDPRIASPLAAAVAARQRFANLVVRSLQEPESANRARLDEAREEKEEAERALAELSADARAEAARAHVGLNEVRGALPPGAALVSFIKYNRTLVATGSRPAWQPPVPSYAAFVQRAGHAEVAFVSLGAAAPLEARVQQWREEASGRSLIAGVSGGEANRRYRLAAARLRAAMWDPIEPYLTGATPIFIVPDGLLNVVSVAALPARDGRYLLEGPAVIHYLSTERDLTGAARTPASSGLLAVGGATFDGQPSTSTPTAQRSSCEAFSRIRFPALPGSRREVAEISRLWPEADARDVTVLRGTAATETAVKQAVSGRRVVHLATHGFFLGGECIPGMPGTRAVGGLSRKGVAALTDADNPLLLSGLALAWANHRDKARTRQDDGILTAEEIAGLNLQGTEWAVLSACDTGLGEIRAGEGVFGLRRAFQIAGARTVVMSLWAVEDSAARVWMRALYEGRFRQQRSTADAVSGASLAVLADRRTRGLSTHPFYWAGFVAAGDWR